MNKQEALKRIEVQKETLIRLTGWAVYVYIEELIKSLDESEKIKIPQFVADWIEEKRDMGWKLAQMLLQADLNEQYGRWVVDNQETFARAWLDGYEVEEEKRYLVKIKGDIKENMLVYGEVVGRYFFTKSYSLSNARYPHTRKELEQAGFGWVFDCPGIEIEEVE